LAEGSNNLYYTEDRFNTSFLAKNTDSLDQGSTNRYYTEGHFTSSLLATTTDSLDEGSTNLYYTDARAIDAALNAYSGGTGVTYDGSTGLVSIGQEVETTSDVKFSKSIIDGIHAIDTDVTTTTATTQTAIATFAKSEYMSATMSITITEGTNYHTTEILVVHDDTTAYMTSFGTLETNGDLASFDVDISGSDVRVLATPASANSTEFKVVRHGIGTIVVGTGGGAGAGGSGGSGGGAGGDAGGSSSPVSGSGDTLLFISASS
jgi:hypothetical protein